MIALIEPEWLERIHFPNDYIRLEIEESLRAGIPILPIVCRITSMPLQRDLPQSISNLSMQNARVVSVSLDFESDMRYVGPEIDSIIERASVINNAVSHPCIVNDFCCMLQEYFMYNLYPSIEPEHRYDRYGYGPPDSGVEFESAWLGQDLQNWLNEDSVSVGLIVHRVRRLAESVEIHFLLTFRGGSDFAIYLLGWAMHEIDKNPTLEPDDSRHMPSLSGVVVRIRPSHEDGREIWKLITDHPLMPVLPYIALLSPRAADSSPQD